MRGALVATSTRAYPRCAVAGGGVEQDPDDWWRAFLENTAEVCAGIDTADIVAIGIDGTFPNLIALDEAGEVGRPAMIWADVRAAAESAELERELPASWQKTFTNGRVGAEKTAAKLLWLERHEPESFARMRLLLPCSQDYITYRLTGEAATDVTCSSTTRLVNAAHDDWDDEILGLLGIDRTYLPPLMRPTDVVGYVSDTASRESGLTAGTPVICGTGDSYVASVSLGMNRAGVAYVSGGTSAGVYGMAGTEGGGCVRVGGEASASGASLTWLADTICTEESARAKASGASRFDLIMNLAQESVVGAHGCMFHPHLSGERFPRFNEAAKGSFVGITLTTTRADLVRAVAEGIAFNCRSSSTACVRGGAHLRA